MNRLHIWLSVFALTLAQLMVGPLLAVVAAVQVAPGTTPNYHAIVVLLGISTLSAVLLSVAAAFYALSSRGQAMTAFQKALRTLFEGVGQTLSSVVLNTVNDVVSLPRLLVPLLIGVIVAAGVTYLQNLRPVVVPVLPDTG